MNSLPRPEERQNVIILLSGGIDSAACVHYYLKEKFSPEALFIGYGQAAMEKEYESAKKIASYYNIKLDVIKVEILNRFGQGEIKGRNAFFIMVCLMKYSTFSGLISLGIHAGVPYYDSTVEFVSDMKTLLDKYTDGRIRIDAPFLHWQKPMIYEYCKKNKVPIELTYSCELGKEPPCGQCRSCLDRKALDVS